VPTFDLAYGKERVRIDVPSDDSDGVSEETPPPRISLRRAFDEAWNCPIEMGGPAELIEPGERVVVVITDHTRPTPTREVFPLLWEKINRRVAVEDVTLLVATGTHRASTDEELESMLGELRDEFWVIVHDCDRDTVEIGTTTLGTPIALRATIEANHARLTDPRSAACVYEGNPINEEMVEAARWVGLDFIGDVVLSSAGEEGFRLGGYKAVYHAQDLRRATIYLRSELDDGTVRRFFMEPVRDVTDVLEEATRRFGDDCRVLVIPQAADTFPVCHEA